MSIDKPGGGSDAAPDRPRRPEYQVPRPDNPAARVRSSSREQDAPVTRADRGADAEAHRLARLARRSADSPPPEAEVSREPRPGGKGVITHVHSEFHGRSLDLYTDGTRWVSGDAFSVKQEERPDLATDRPPVGQDLVDEANEKGSVKDRLLRELWEEKNNASDAVRDNATNLNDHFVRIPTGSHEGTPPQNAAFTAQQHPVTDVGTVAVALLAAGLGIERAKTLLMEHLKGTRKGIIDDAGDR